MCKELTVGDLKKLIADKDDAMPVVAFYDLNDWPGDCWSPVTSDIKIVAPITLTKTGSANPGAKVVSFVFDLT